MSKKIKSYIRGDSGLSDSQLTRSQASFFKKHKYELDKLERCGKMAMKRQRREVKARQPKSKKSLWQRIKGWFNVE